MILDASAVLAYLQDEEGSLQVQEVLSEAFISTVNWSEVVQKLRARSVDDNAVCLQLEALGLRFIAFDKEQAEKAGELWKITSAFGLSLADRVCLAVAMVKGLSMMTADTVWQELGLDLKVRLIR